MTKQNYRQAKRNREESRKKRQIEKRQRKVSRVEDSTATPGSPVSDPNADPTPSP